MNSSIMNIPLRISIQ